MKLLLCVLGLLVLSLTGTWSQREQYARLEISKANNIFTYNMYGVLRRNPGNLFFSPLSVEAVLAMAWLGAVGETAQQMSRGLALPNNRQIVEQGFSSMLTNLQGLNSEVTLDIANRIFAQQGSELLDSFQASAKHYFLADAQEVQFQRSHEAAHTINQWVEQKTRNRIKDLISADSLDSNTLMVLVNAIYFKGKWLSQFEPRTTRPSPFHIDLSNVKEVQMMRIVSEFPYAELHKAKVLQLPYVGEHLSMLIFLPDDINGLTEFESSFFSQLDLNKLVNSMSDTEVSVSLPKFRMETTIELNDVLKELGMTAMFGANANFSGIAKHNLAVSRVVQKAFVEVTEEGSEAAAATGVQIVALSGAIHPYHPRIFNANHPFLFIIREDDTGTILFMGRYTGP